VRTLAADLVIEKPYEPDDPVGQFGSGPFISMTEITNVLKERLGDKPKKAPDPM